MEWTANSKTRMLYWLGLLLLNTPNFTHQELANLNTGEGPGLGTGSLHFSGNSEPVVNGAVMTESVYDAKEGEGNFSLEKLGHSLSRLEGSLGSLVQSFLTVQRSVVNLEQLQELLVLLLEDILKQTANMSKGKVHKQGSEVTYQDKLANSKSSNESQDEDDDMRSEDRDRTDKETDLLPASRVMTPVGGIFDPINNIIDGKQSVATTSWTDGDTSGGASSGGSNSDENFSSVGALHKSRQDEVLRRSSQWAEPMTADGTDISTRLQNVISRINSKLAFALKHQPDHDIKSVQAESPLDSALGQLEPLEIKSFEDDLLQGDGKRGPVTFHVKLKQILPMVGHSGQLVVSHGGPLTGPEKASSPFLEDFEDTSGKESSGERPTGMINNLLLSEAEEENVTGTHEIPSGEKQSQHSGVRKRRQTEEQIAVPTERDSRDKNESVSQVNNDIILSQSQADSRMHDAPSAYQVNATTDNTPSSFQLNQTRDKILSVARVNEATGKNLSIYNDIETNDNDLSTSQVNQTNDNTLSLPQGNNTPFPRVKAENASESGPNTVFDSVMKNKTFSPEIITYLLKKKTLFSSTKAQHLDTGSVRTYLTSILQKHMDIRPQDHATVQTYPSTTPVNHKIRSNPGDMVQDDSFSPQMKNQQRLSNENSSNIGGPSSPETKLNKKLRPEKILSQTIQPSQLHSLTDPTRRAGVLDTKVIIMPPSRKISQAAFNDNVQQGSEGVQEPSKDRNLVIESKHDVKNTLRAWVTTTAGGLGKPDDSVKLSTEETRKPSQVNILTGESSDFRQQVWGLENSKRGRVMSPETSETMGKNNLSYNDDYLEEVDENERNKHFLLNSFQAEVLGSESHTSDVLDDEDSIANREDTNTLFSEQNSREIIESRTVPDESNTVLNKPFQNVHMQVENHFASLLDKQVAIGKHDTHNTVLSDLPVRATSFSILRDLMKARPKRQKRYTGDDAKQNTGTATQTSFPMSGFNFQSRTPSVEYRRHQDSSSGSTQHYQSPSSGQTHHYLPPASSQTHHYPPHSFGQTYHRPFLNHHGGGFHRPYHTSLNYAHYLNNLGINLPSLLQQRNQDHEETTMQDTSMDMEDMLTNLFQRYWQRIYNHYIQSTTTEGPDLDWDDATLQSTKAQQTTAPSENITVSVMNTTNSADGSPSLIEHITENSTATVT
ncbi:unnamed protein product [Lymnaea stagnalis]|uniref:Uncharacterized protein n=1 Tax=Lymnaea stagnalis TaxID=6523 RepID=A0AAV2GZX3_LYMST